jgi:hypothetical protein
MLWATAATPVFDSAAAGGRVWRLFDHQWLFPRGLTTRAAASGLRRIQFELVMVGLVLVHASSRRRGLGAVEIDGLMIKSIFFRISGSIKHAEIFFVVIFCRR